MKPKEEIKALCCNGYGPGGAEGRGGPSRRAEEEFYQLGNGSASEELEP